MKKSFPFLSILLAIFSCNKVENAQESELILREYDQIGVHVTVSGGCPIDTRAQDSDYDSFTVNAEKDGQSVTLYEINTKDDYGFITSETFFPDGTQFSTVIIYKGKVVSYVLNPDWKETSYVGSSKSGSALKRWWTAYKDCVEVHAMEMYESLQDNIVDIATCEHLPCATACILVSGFNCLTGGWK